MVTPTVDEKSFPHTPSPPTKQDSQAASNTLHLVDLADGHYTLCGLPLAEVLTGGYCEHLDGQIGDPHRQLRGRRQAMRSGDVVETVGERAALRA